MLAPAPSLPSDLCDQKVGHGIELISEILAIGFGLRRKQERRWIRARIPCVSPDSLGQHQGFFFLKTPLGFERLVDLELRRPAQEEIARSGRQGLTQTRVQRDSRSDCGLAVGVVIKTPSFSPGM